MKFISISILIILSLNSTAQDGKDLFNKNCKACHNIGGGKKVGPDLQGVTKKRNLDWLFKFITSSKDLIGSGDPDAKAIFEDFGKRPMPSHSLSQAEITAILNFINSGGKESNETSSSLSQKNNTLFKPSYEIGRDLFTGKIPLKNGGASCISCHSLKDEGVFAGGTLAKDLSSSYTEGVVNSMLTSIPAMVNSFKTHELTIAEVANLEYFLKVVKDNQLYSHSIKSNSFLFLGGIIVFCLLFVITNLFWRHTKKYGVKDEIFKRQVKTN